jgi:hypothetical protein
MMPKIALVLAKALSIAALLAAILAVWVAALVFPEYSSDQVWQGHHEGLEHVLHMAHHVLGSKVGGCGGRMQARGPPGGAGPPRLGAAAGRQFAHPGRSSSPNPTPPLTLGPR